MHHGWMAPELNEDPLLGVCQTCGLRAYTLRDQCVCLKHSRDPHFDLTLLLDWMRTTYCIPSAFQYAGGSFGEAGRPDMCMRVNSVLRQMPPIIWSSQHASQVDPVQVESDQPLLFTQQSPNGLAHNGDKISGRSTNLLLHTNKIYRWRCGSHEVGLGGGLGGAYGLVDRSVQAHIKPN